jgi:di/tricarboxylate transporter
MVAQILAVTIFVAMFVLIVIDKIERQYITLGCGVITLVVVFGLCMHSVTAITDTLNIHSIFTGTFWYTGGAAEESSSGINWATIIFVAGMMVMVEGMARVGFFRWLCMRIAKLVHYKTMAIFMTFMIMSVLNTRNTSREVNLIGVSLIQSQKLHARIFYIKEAFVARLV